MTNKNKKRVEVDMKDAVLTIMYSQNTLIKVLEEKGLLTEGEVLEKVKELKDSGTKH